VTLQALQELGALLVEIHGQHAHLSLLQASEQRRLLDESGSEPGLVKDTQELFNRWKSLSRELTARRQEAADRAAREELLRYQLEEMARLEISNLDYQGLLIQHTRLANVGRIGALSREQLDLLYDNEQLSVTKLLVQARHAAKELEQLAPELNGLNGMLQEAEIQVKEAVATLRHAIDDLECDPKQLEALDERLADLHHLARKHHTHPQELPRSVRNSRMKSTVLPAERNGSVSSKWPSWTPRRLIRRQRNACRNSGRRRRNG